MIPEPVGTYTWTVTSGNSGTWAFVNGTNANTKYPQIRFDNFDTYTVTVTHTNNCGTVSASQKLTFNTAPVVNAGPDQAICYNDASFTLAGSVTGSTSSQTWTTTGTGTFSPNANALNATYTPSVADKNAGTVTLTLTATTTLPAPCNLVSDQVVLTIKPRTFVNSLPSKTICTGTAVAYSPSSNIAGVTFSWTATGGPGAGGFSASGNGATINDVLTNSNPTTNATVTYTITPNANGCAGDPFTFTVTVTPNPVLTATPVNANICSQQNAVINLSANLANTKYTWTSTAQAGVTGNTNNATPSTATSITNTLVNSTLVPKTVDYIITPISANNCPGTPVTVTITVEPQPSTPNAGADVSICNTGSFVLQGNQPAVGTGKWTLVSGQSGVSFVDDTQYNTPVNGLAAGQVYVFRWTIGSAASCAPKSDDVSITVNPASVGGTVAGSTAVCSGTNGGTLTLSGHTGNVIRWESSINGGTTWVAIANTTTTLNYTNLNTTTQYRAIVQSGVCAPDPAVAATITVSPAVVAANAGADQELCNQTSATLTANSPLPNTGLWTQAGGPAGATFVDATSATTQVNGLIPGQIYVFTWTISGQAPCPPSTDEVQIKINLPSDGGTTAGSASVCSGSSSGQITLSGQLGNVVRWEISTNGGTTWQTVNNTTTAINYSNLTTTTQYRAVVKNGTCAEANSAISTITVNPAVATANAGTSQELCNQTTTTLAGNSPLPNTGLWTQKSGPAGAVFADATLPNTQVTGLIPGQTYVFTWTISGQAPCPPSSSDVQVQVNLPSDGGVTTGSTSVCSGSGSGQITVSGQVGSVVRWESSTDGGATWQIINSTATSINYSNLTATTQYRAVVRNGNCATANSTISTITVNPGSISANAGPDQELCNQTSTTLAGNSPQTQTGLWTQVSGSAVTFADASLYNTQVSGLIPGQTYVFRWTINGLAPCPPSMDDMQVKVNLPSDGGATAGSTAVCSGSGNGSITLSGQVGTIQGWEQSTDGGTTWSPINNTTGSVAYSNLTITTQYRAIVKNGNCAPAYSTVATITVNPGSISANAGPNQELCNQTSTTLAGNSPQTQSGLWAQTGGPAGASFADANLYNTQVSGLIPGNTYTFTWTISGLAPCPPSSASVTIKVNLPSDGGATAGSTAVCSGSGNGSITLSGQVGTIQGWEQSTDGGTTWSPINNTTGSVAYSNLTITTQYRAIVKNGNCAPAYSTVATITVNQAVAQANAGSDQTLCNSSSITLQGNSPLTNIGQWTLTSGQTGVTFADASQYNTQVNGLVGGQTYTFRWTISGSAPCPSTNDEVVITNLAPLTNTNITTPFSTACNGQVITLAGNVPSGGNGTYTYVWESSNNGGATWTTINGQTSPSLTITVNASLSYRRTVNSGNCSAISNVLQLTALPAIANNSISADHAICVGTNATPISGSQPTGGDGNNYTYGWEQSTDNGATWTAIIGANGKDYVPGAITQTTSYRRLVSSSACAGALQHISNVVKVTVNPNAKAEFSFTRDLDCFPFAINASNVKATAYPDRNATYTWYADNVVIGTGINFPGYTIATENTAVVIKLVATSSLGCSQDEMSHTFRTRPNILATFTPSAVNGCGPLDVDFTNTSNTLTGVTFEWRVNNVIAGTSADFRYRFDADPFGEDKDYTVILTITGPCGKSVSAPQKITVYGTPIATGTPDKTRGCSPFTVNFRNTSPGSTNTYTYEIDGVIVNGPSTSKTDFPYTFTTDVVRTYKVKVTATNTCGTDTREYVIVVSPNTIKPGFTVDGNKLRGCAPFDVDFTNSTVGASQYVYNFEPGQSAEISVNNRPEIKHHRFDKPGTYVVTMLATNDCSTAPVQTVTITVDPQPVAAFSANLTIGCDGLAVKFTNTSKDAIGYVWDFGDGSPTSTEVAPTHVYKGSARNYTVKLTAINSLGCPTTEEKVDYIRIVGPPKADFSISPTAVISIPNYTFKFTNESSNGAQTYKWTFGDGDASTLKDPAHTYLDTGRFLVTLRTYNEQGCVDSIQKYVHIMGIPGYVYVPNSFMPGGTNVPLQKFIAVGAGIKSWKMSVFNKWGQVLWETTKLEDGKPVEGWDGTYNNVAQPQGIYFWKIEVQLINGTEWKGVTYDKSAPKRTGEIYLIR
nr:PKD domain-containing protein [Pedobacter sp. ASV12]